MVTIPRSIQILNMQRLLGFTAMERAVCRSCGDPVEHPHETFDLCSSCHAEIIYGDTFTATALVLATFNSWSPDIDERVALTVFNNRIPMPVETLARRSA